MTDFPVPHVCGRSSDAPVASRSATVGRGAYSAAFATPTARVRVRIVTSSSAEVG